MRPAILALVLLLLFEPALADRATAESHAALGDKALLEKDWAQAEDQFRKALAADASLHSARYGLSQALLGSGRGSPGIEELRKFVSDVKADKSATPAWKALVTKAEKQLQGIEASGADLQKIVGRWADDLVAFARKSAPKDPSNAKRAARLALELRPEDKGAGAVLEKLGESAKGPPVVLFNGTDLSKWSKVEAPYFQLADGHLVCDVPKGSRIVYADQPVEGDFDIRMEARLLAENEGDPLVSLMLYGTGPFDYLSLGVLNRKAYFVDRTTESEKQIFLRKPIAELKKPFDPEQWTTYEMRFRGDSVLALVNGELLATEPRSERRKGGFVGINVQGAKAAIRLVEFQPR